MSAAAPAKERNLQSTIDINMNGKILLVEDEADLAMIVADTLSQQGYTVTLAANGDEGLHKFFEGGFDIVIADVMMPKMDGFESLGWAEH